MFKQVIRKFASVADKSIDVTIIGAGPAGLSLGAALKNSPITNHLNVKIIESMDLKSNLDKFHDEAPIHLTNRCVSLTPQTIQYFKKIGSWELMNLDRVQSYDEMKIIDGVSDSHLQFEHEDIATMLENVNIQNSLYQRIKQFSEIDIIDKTKVVLITEGEYYQWPELTLDNGEKFHTRLLIGCDGANSPVRQYAQIEKRGWEYHKWGVVLTLQSAYETFKLPTAWQRFLPQGPVLLLPLPENQMSLVWSTTLEISNGLLQLPEHVFVKLINAAYRLDQDELNMLYGMLQDEKLEEIIDWRLDQFAKNKTPEQLEQYPVPILSMTAKSRGKFPLKLSHADTYVSPRVALVGDAAHTVHPLAGQGLNLGQLDVKSLVSALEKGCERGLDIGSMLVLEPYFSDRYLPNQIMLGVCDGLQKIYSTQSWPIVAGRSLGVSILNKIPFVKEMLVQNVSGK